MATPGRRVDRRIQRTRHALQRAFIEVVREKGFAATSIQDITERANVNRGTFYLHFTDKYMLTESFVREDFQRLLTNTLPSTSSWDRKTLHLLIQTLLDHFERKYRHQPHVSQTIAPLIEVTPLIERAIHEVLTELLLTWLKQSRCKEAQDQATMETTARVVSWAIFGSVVQWSQEETVVSSEQMAQTILRVILEGVTHLVPDILPE
jgi:AcrR family transcriptional regulator